MATYDIMARRYVTDRSKQSWLLSLPMTGLMSVLGVYHASHWFLTGDISESAFVITTARLLKDYMLVELGSELFFNFENIAILETVIHHITYYCFFNHVIAVNLTGFIRPFYVFEIPAFMRTVSHIFPRYHHELAFGVCFGVFRIVWPLYAISFLPVLAWYYYVLFTCITASHLYWMTQWLANTKH